MSGSTLRVGIFALILVVFMGVLGYRMYGGPSEEERREAAVALGNLGPQAGPDAVPTLVAGLKDRDAGVRSASATALGQIGHDNLKAEEGLIASLGDPSDRVRAAAADALAQRPTPRAAKPLAAALKDQTPGVRAQAVRALSRIQGLEAGDAEALAAAFRDADPTVRAAVFGAVSERTQKSKKGDAAAKQYEAIILAALKDPSPRVRLLASRSLRERPEGTIADPDALAMAEIAAMSDESPQVRMNAVIALAAIPKIAGRPLNEKTVRAMVARVPALIAGAMEDDTYTRAESLAALRTVCKAAGDVKLKPEADQAKALRDEMVAALARATSTNRPVLLPILPMVAPLAEADESLVKDSLKAAMEDKSPAIRRAAAGALKDFLAQADSGGESRGAVAVELLRPALADPDGQVRGAAYTGLWQSPRARKIGGESLEAELHGATRACIKSLTSDADPANREASAWCLSWTDREEADDALAALREVKAEVDAADAAEAKEVAEAKKASEAAEAKRVAEGKPPEVKKPFNESEETGEERSIRLAKEAKEAKQRTEKGQRTRLKGLITKAIARLEAAKSSSGAWPEPSWEPMRTRPGR